MSEPSAEAMAIWRRAVHAFYATDSEDLARTNQHEQAALIIDAELEPLRQENQRLHNLLGKWLVVPNESWESRLRIDTTQALAPPAEKETP